jgi:hypothetical protein
MTRIERIRTDLIRINPFNPCHPCAILLHNPFQPLKLFFIRCIV